MSSISCTTRGGTLSPTADQLHADSAPFTVDEEFFTRYVTMREHGMLLDPIFKLPFNGTLNL